MINQELQKKKKFRLSPSQIIVLGFFLVILIGGLLLTLPFAAHSGNSTGFLDSLFTATSAVCVTGLVVLDTGSHWSIFGKTVILMLIQIGGLGFMTVATFGAVIMGRKINLRERILIQESLNQYNLEGVVKLSKKILYGTLLIEAVGAILLTVMFYPEFGIKKGLAMGIFHSVSAFCNAGFDIMGDFRSMTGYVANPLMNFTVLSLIILGGLGFTVMFDVIHIRKFSKFRLHTKIVLVMTALLILIPFVIFFVIEHNNMYSIGQLTLLGKIQASLFQVISPRTAGFNSIDLTTMTDSSKFLSIVLMFIGGSPASTAGGIKTVSVAVLMLAVHTLIKGRERLEVFGRRISYKTVNKALAVLALGLTVIFVGTMILLITEHSSDFLTVLYEVTSAFGTVGLSLGLTPSLSAIGKLTLMVIMFVGRVGAITILLALASKETKDLYHYPEEKVIVG